jgi:RNA polymerase sigma factor for flagellar operon FliA
MIVRINTIESTSPLANIDSLDGANLPPVLVPSEPMAPDRLFEQNQTRGRVRGALSRLPARERRILALYYFGDATMKQIGQQIGVNESRVSQLHARAIQRLRRLLATPAMAGPRLVAKHPRAAYPRPAAAKVARRVRQDTGDRRAVA